MPLTLAIPKETAAGERRVALDPQTAQRFAKMGFKVLLEKGAGLHSFHADESYTDAEVVDNTADLYARADIVLKLQPPTEEEIGHMKEGAILAGFLMPYRYPERIAKLRDQKVTALSMEMIPRISRAQTMDALSSQAAIAGYKAGLLAAERTTRFFPMLTTAAGTIRPAKVLVIGAGVAGLQAIATCRRLGALVEAYDVRGATKEQVQSLGAKFVDTGLKAEGDGGYARELTDEEKQQQQNILIQHIIQVDAVITTASVPGKPAPKIISAEVVEQMKPGAVIVDLAAEGGGNCELTVPGEDTEHADITILGPLNVPSMLCVHASEMYARNLLNYLTPMIKEDGQLELDWDDEVIKHSALTHDGEIRNQAVRESVEGASS